MTLFQKTQSNHNYFFLLGIKNVVNRAESIKKSHIPHDSGCFMWFLYDLIVCFKPSLQNSATLSKRVYGKMAL